MSPEFVFLGDIGAMEQKWFRQTRKASLANCCSSTFHTLGTMLRTDVCGVMLQNISLCSTTRVAARLVRRDRTGPSLPIQAQPGQTDGVSSRYDRTAGSMLRQPVE